jgi:hypothetical protein
MRASVTTFERTTEASFPENEALPKKGEDEKICDKRFNEWWDDVKLNLSRLDDQITKYTKDQLAENISLNKQETDQAIAGLDEKTIQLLNEVSTNLQSVQNNLYSV